MNLLLILSTHKSEHWQRAIGNFSHRFRICNTGFVRPFNKSLDTFGFIIRLVVSLVRNEARILNKEDN